MSSLTVSIVLDRVDITYRAGDKVSGVVSLNATRSLSHGGVTLLAEGRVELQPSARSQGVFDAFYSTKPLQTLQHSVSILPAGKLTVGVTKVPFDFVLRPNDPLSTGTTFFTGRLFETYHGVYVNVQYSVTCTVMRGMMSRDECFTQEFVVHCPTSLKAGQIEAHRLQFHLSPQSLLNFKRDRKLPDFVFEGFFERDLCHLDQPISGEFVVRKCDTAIKSVELQLIRVETLMADGKEAREATEIQNLQIVDGNIGENVVIPIFMILPRLFTCSSAVAKEFKIDFEMNLLVILEDDYTLTENFPLRFYR